MLELPLAQASGATIRKAYRRVSLSVHPDKVSHPRASEAFRKTFDAMKLLMEPQRQAARLRQIERGETSSDAADNLSSETRWWDAASVSEMEQVRRRSYQARARAVAL